MANQNQPQILAFKRLNLAGLCFDQAQALARHLIQAKPDPTQYLYSPMVTGVVVTYMRPFMEAEGLGALPAEFERFTDHDLQEAHDQLKESRNQLYAHRDVRNGAALPTLDGTIPFDMDIEFDGSQSYKLMPGVIEIPPENLPDFVRLCEFQRQRITAKITKAWPSLTGSKTYAPGKYKVGVDFP